MDGSFAGYIGSCVDVTERKLVEEIRADVIRTLLEAQEQEQTRIARELHDDISQKLALLSVEISEMKETLPHGELRSQMDALEKQALELCSDTQSLSHELHSSKLGYLGLVLAMKNFSKEFEDKHNVEIEFDGEDVPSDVPQNIALCCSGLCRKDYATPSSTAGALLQSERARTAYGDTSQRPGFGGRLRTGIGKRYPRIGAHQYAGTSSTRERLDFYNIKPPVWG